MLLNCGFGEGFENSLDCKEIQPVYSEGDQPWDFFGRKVMTNLDSILRSQRHYFAKVHLVKAMVFSVVMYGCELLLLSRFSHV